MKYKHLIIAILFTSILLIGCTRHSVRVTAEDSSSNGIVIFEKVRPWPVTIINKIVVSLPEGKIIYSNSDYESQTNFPEMPIKLYDHSELCFDNSVVIRDLNIDGGWLAIYRNSVEIRLLSRKIPATFNGRYTIKCPFLVQKP